MEDVLHLRKHVKLHIYAGLLRALGQPAAVVQQCLVAGTPARDQPGSMGPVVASDVVA
jgi:hypothetical protein